MLARIALGSRPPLAVAATSVPSAALVLLALAPWYFHPAHADAQAALIFAASGIFFPSAVTLLSFQSNRLLGPNLAGALGNITPVFAVGFAALILGEGLSAVQALGIAVLIAGVVLLSLRGKLETRSWPLWMLTIPFAAAAIRGLAQPVVKFGLLRWSDPFAATLISYVVSASVILAIAFARRERTIFAFERRSSPLFALTGVANAASVLFLYQALAHGRVALVAPLVAMYPFFTLLLSALFLHDQRLHARLVIGIIATVAGVAIVLLR